MLDTPLSVQDQCNCIISQTATKILIIKLVNNGDGLLVNTPWLMGDDPSPAPPPGDLGLQH